MWQIQIISDVNKSDHKPLDQGQDQDHRKQDQDRRRQDQDESRQNQHQEQDQYNHCRKPIIIGKVAIIVSFYIARYSVHFTIQYYYIEKAVRTQLNKN